MQNQINSEPIFVSSEIGRLRRLLIHSPDGGIGKIIPSKFSDWLYDDTVHLIKMQKEYNEYVKLLIYFLDPEKAKLFEKTDDDATQSNVYKPGKKEFYNSSLVIESQKLLADILENEKIKLKLISAICALEGCSQRTQEKLEKLDGTQLAKVFITGTIDDENPNNKFIFPPIPNFVFTRDIGIIIKDHLLLSKPAKPARKREAILFKYMAYYGLFENQADKIIEITEDSDFFLEDEEKQKAKIITIEGGDLMVISNNHLIVGCSERTSPNAVNEIIHKIFSIQELGIEKISVVKVSKERGHMHIDTIFTQIRKDAWVLYGFFSEILAAEKEKSKRDFTRELVKSDQEPIVSVVQYQKTAGKKYTPDGKSVEKKKLSGIEQLLKDISIADFGVKEEDVRIIYAGNDEFPYDEREQWTDACNLLAIKEGVVIGYDRNEKTADAFKLHLGFEVVKSKDLIEIFKSGQKRPDEVKNTLILLPSTELSRARGGSHCMSMPLLRDDVI